jgi:hypothetical protein
MRDVRFGGLERRPSHFVMVLKEGRGSSSIFRGQSQCNHQGVITMRSLNKVFGLLMCMLLSMTIATTSQAQAQQGAQPKPQPAQPAPPSALSATNASRDSEASPALDIPPLEALIRAMREVRLAPLYAGPKNTCYIGIRCDVKIVPIDLYDKAGKLVACAAQVGEVEIKLGANPTPNKQTDIYWTIDKSSVPPDVDYRFAKDLGLIVFSDDYGSTAKHADTVSAAQVYMKHKYKDSRSVVIYYPLVFQHPATGAPTLCGSADPQIVNN